jgi:elongation factor P
MQANDLRKGQVINFNGESCLVMEVMHRTPGNLRAFVQAKLRNLRTGRSGDQRFNSTETVELLTTDRQTLELSYIERDTWFFINPTSYEQFELNASLIGDAKNYIVPNGTVEVLFVDDVPVSVSLPSTVTLKIVESADGVKGDTASNVQKPAKLETGMVVQVPLFIKEGESIKVSTDNGSYMGRA